MQEKEISRREFLARSAAGAAALGAAGTVLLPSARAKGAVGANDRINVAVIGCGGMGSGHLGALVRDAKDPKHNIRVAAVCDIFEVRLDRAKAVSGAKGYHDYRKLLDSPDVDAVWIASPEHWHAKMTIDALEAGKDVYCEKPMTRYWQDARDVYRCAERTGRVMQVGSQSCSDERWSLASDLIRAGKIGQVIWSQISYSRNNKEGQWNGGFGPKKDWKKIDWKAFLGPAPWRPFDPDRFFNWRKYWDYSGGIATDLFAHSFHSLCKALNPGFPIRVTASGGIYVHDDREVPDTFHMMVDYETKQNIVAVSSMANSYGVEEVIRGHEATLTVGSRLIKVRPESPFADKHKKESILIERRKLDRQRRDRRTDPSRPLFARYGWESQDLHRWNFLDCVRSRNRKTNCDPKLGYEVDVAIGLAVEGYRQNKVKLFDPKKEEEIPS